MNIETSESTFGSTGSTGSTGSSVKSGSTGVPAATLNGNSGVVRRVAQKAHDAVDMLEQSVSSGSEKVTGWQQEYGDVCREQVKANPLTAVGIAFAAGLIISRILR